MAKNSIKEALRNSKVIQCVMHASSKPVKKLLLNVVIMKTVFWYIIHTLSHLFRRLKVLLEFLANI